MNEQVHDPLARAAARGMSVAYHAAVDPHRMAIVSPAGRRSFGELNARANQLACALRTAGVTPGDGIALLVGNRPEFEEWGESVKSVVELQPGYLPTAELECELLAFCRQHLAGFKCPRSVDFRSDLPRLATGKILRREVRAPYWAGRDKTI
jgi:acyl-coenzyme A synthetase/AMP-(fatty) acid ligase